MQAAEQSISPTIAKRILQLALPMTGTQLITVGSGFLCMIMLSHLGHLVLAASALIFSVSFTLVAIGISLLLSLSILVGHVYGKQDYKSVGSLWQQGWLLAVIISLPCLLVYWNIYPILIFFGQDPEVVAIVKTFFHASIWGLVPLFLGVCNQQLCYGVHKQKFDMFINILGVIILLITARLLIFGKFGFPKLGVAGLGYAQAIQCLFYFLVTTICFSKLNYFKKFEMFQLRISRTWHILKNILQIGWPIGLQISGEVLSFVVCATFVGWLGTVPLAAYQIMLQYEFLSVIPLFALSQASGVLIGQAIGSKNYADVKKLGLGSLYIAGILCLTVAVIMVCFPKFLASFYLNIHNPKNAQILTLATQLFIAVAASQFLDGIRNVLLGSLRGLLDTRFAMIVGLLIIWLVSVPLGYIFAFPLHGGAVGAMIGWIVGMVISVSIFWYRWQIMSKKYACHPY